MDNEAFRTYCVSSDDLHELFLQARTMLALGKLLSRLPDGSIFSNENCVHVSALIHAAKASIDIVPMGASWHYIPYQPTGSEDGFLEEGYDWCFFFYDKVTQSFFRGSLIERVWAPIDGWLGDQFYEIPEEELHAAFQHPETERVDMIPVIRPATHEDGPFLVPPPIRHLPIPRKGLFG